MLTGVTTREMADALPEAERPTAIAADADELAAILAELAAVRRDRGRGAGTGARRPAS